MLQLHRKLTRTITSGTFLLLFFILFVFFISHSMSDVRDKICEPYQHALCCTHVKSNANAEPMGHATLGQNKTHGSAAMMYESTTLLND